MFPNTAFYTFVETAYCHGIISGYSCGGPGEPCDSQNWPYFRQFNDATRGHIAKIVYGSITSTQTSRHRRSRARREGRLNTPPPNTTEEPWGGDPHGSCYTAPLPDRLDSRGWRRP